MLKTLLWIAGIGFLFASGIAQTIILFLVAIMMAVASVPVIL